MKGFFHLLKPFHESSINDKDFYHNFHSKRKLNDSFFFFSSVDIMSYGTGGWFPLLMFHLNSQTFIFTNILTVFYCFAMFSNIKCHPPVNARSCQWPLPSWWMVKGLFNHHPSLCFVKIIYSLLLKQNLKNLLF